MFLNRTIKIKPVTIVNSAFILILISSMLLSIALPKRAGAAPFEGNLQDKFTQYNLLVGFAVNCGLDGGGDRDVTQDDVDNVYDTDAGDDNNGYGADDYESDAGRQINIGYSASGYNNINGMTSCEDIVVHVLDSIIDYHEIDIGGPSNDEEGKSYIVNFLLDDLGGNKNDIIEHLEDNDGTDQLEDIFAVDDKVKLANGAWRDFVSNFMEPMYKDLEEELRADATETDIANWLAPALNYCLDWVDSPPASSDATRIDLSAKAGLYGRYPVDGWNTERMRRLFGADFRVGDDGTIVGGKDWADIAGGQFNFLFRDFARYASVDGSNFADAFAEKLNFLADLTYFINPISLFFGGPDDDKEGYFFPFGYASYIFFNDVPLSRSNGQDGFRRGGLLSCQNIEENLDKWDDGIEGEGDGRSVRAKTPDPDSGVVIPDDPGAIIDTTPSCESEGGAFSFIVCPLLKGADAGFDWFNDRITAALNVNEDYYGNTVCPGGGTNCPDSEKVSGVRNAWANFRNIAYLLLIPTMLILVIGTALGFQFLDAYTVKRAMPRLLVAIIFIAVSFDVTRIMVELSNTVGQGIAGLIAAPFGGLNELSLQNIFGAGDFVGENIGEGLLFTGIAVAAAGAIFFAGVTIGTMLITLGIALLSVIIIFAILSLREMLIIFLMVISPIAILAWIFPGNDKPWKLWWGTFTKLLLFFPVVVGVIVTGRAFAYIVNVTDSDEGIFISTLIKLAAFVGPYFFIPALFKFAGGALGNLAGMVNDRSKGVFDRAKNARAKGMKDTRERTAEGNRFQTKNALTKRLNRAGMYGANVKEAGFVPGRMRANMDAAVARNEHQAASKFMKENETAAQFFQDDVVTKATLMKDDHDSIAQALRDTGDARFQDEAVVQQTAALVMKAKKEAGTSVYRKAAVRALAPTGTAFKDSGEMLEMINAVYGSDRQGAGSAAMEMKSASMGAGRVDIGGASAGATLGNLGALYDGTKTRDEATKDITGDVLNSQAASTLIHPSMKPDYVRDNIVPVMQQRLEAAAAAAENPNSTPEDHANFMRELANVQKLHQSLTQTNPNLAKIVGDEVMGMQLPINESYQESGPIGPAKTQIVTKTVPDTSPGAAPGATISVQEEVPVDVGVYGPAKPRNVQQLVEKYSGDADFRRYTHSFTQSEEEMQRRGGGGFGSGPTTTPTTGVGGGP